MNGMMNGSDGYTGGMMAWMVFMGLLWTVLLVALIVLAIVATVVLYKRYLTGDRPVRK